MTGCIMDETQKDKMAHKIRALMAKAEDGAATEAEAVAAAEKAKELLDKYQLDLGAVQLIKEGFQNLRSSDQSVESAHIHDSLAYFIGQYTDTIAWRSPPERGRPAECKYFGLKTDVEFAVWLSQSLERFILRKAANVVPLGEKYYDSFRDGVINGINIKLQAAIARKESTAKRPAPLREDFDQAPDDESRPETEQEAQSGPTDLATLDKIGIVRTEAQKLFNFSGTHKTASYSTTYKSNIGAFLAGRAEGKQASLDAPLEDAKSAEQLPHSADED